MSGNISIELTVEHFKKFQEANKESLKKAITNYHLLGEEIFNTIEENGVDEDLKMLVTSSICEGYLHFLARLQKDKENAIKERMN